MKQRQLHTLFLTGIIGILTLNCEFHLDPIPIHGITSVDKTTGPSNTKDFPALTLTGYGFTKATKITVGNNPATVMSVSDDGTTLKFLLPNSPGSFGPAKITATFDGGATVSLDGFSYYLSQITMNPQTSTGVIGANPVSLVAGDFDNDTKHLQDIAVVYSNSNNLDILSNNGQGTFSSPPFYPAANAGNVLVASGDFNQDQLADLVLLPTTGNTMYVYIQDQINAPNMPSFTGKPLTVGQNPKSVTIADVNGDKLPDIITANNDTNNRISIALNTSANKVTSFQASNAVSFPDDMPSSVLAQDFDGDGKVDLAVLPSTQSSFYLLKNTGTGGFVTSFPVSLGYVPQFGIASLLSGGTLPEIAFVNPGASNRSVDILKNQSTTAGFNFTKSPTGYTVGGISTDPASVIAIGDLDKDGFDDLVINTGSQISILLNRTRDGQGITFQSVINIQASKPLQAIVIGEFTGDKLLDIVALPSTGADLILFKNASQ